MKRYFISSIAIAILALGGYGWFGGWIRPPDKPISAASSSVHLVSNDSGSAQGPDSREATLVLMQQVAMLRAEIAELRKKQSVAGTAGLASDENPVERREAPLDAKEMERQKEEWHAHIADVEAAFHEEARDPNWAAAVGSSVRQAFRSDEAVAAKLRNVDCRSRTCRLELSDNGPEPVSDMLMPVLAQLTGSLPKVKSDQIVDANGQKTVVLYMSRRSEG